MDTMSGQGQICTGTSRILVQDTIYNAFLRRFEGTLETVSRKGNQWDAGSSQGPRVSKVQYDRVLGYIEIGKNEGAAFVAWGYLVTEALELTDDTTYGLGAAVFTTNLERTHRVAAEIEAGVV